MNYVWVPSYSLADYRAVFAMSDADLQSGPVLEVAGGTSAFAAEFRGLGGRVVSVDSLYELPAQMLLDAACGTASRLRLTAQSRPELFSPAVKAGPSRFFEVWQDNARRFLGDYSPRGTAYRPWPEGLAGCPAGHFTLTLVGPRLADHVSGADQLADLLTALVALTDGEVRMAHPVTGVGHDSIDLAGLRDRLAVEGVRLSASWSPSVVYCDETYLLTLTQDGRLDEHPFTSRKTMIPPFRKA